MQNDPSFMQYLVDALRQGTISPEPTMIPERPQPNLGSGMANDAAERIRKRREQEQAVRAMMIESGQ
jgi:hypothetical protein